MPILLLLILLSGCAFNNYIDPKGRDCIDKTVLIFRWNKCDNSTAKPGFEHIQDFRLGASQSTSNQTASNTNSFYQPPPLPQNTHCSGDGIGGVNCLTT